MSRYGRAGEAMFDYLEIHGAADESDGDVRDASPVRSELYNS